MQFRILCRAEAEEVPVGVPHIVISITSPDRGPAKVGNGRQCLAVLRLSFYDVTGDEVPINDYEKAAIRNKFKRHHAKKILEFVNVWKDRVGMIVVHCEAGISRSAAVAAALSKHLNGTDDWVWNNDCYRPNPLVYRLLSKRLERGVFASACKSMDEVRKETENDILQKRGVRHL